MPPRPFSISVPQDVLDDLHRRLANTRWPEPIPGAAWDYGADVAYVRELCEYWRSGYDWRKQEAALNRFPQFLAEVDGVDLHFWHVRGNGERPFPLLLVHGWPGSFVEMLAIVPMLTECFHVVVPSLPGYGFSDAPSSAGMSNERIAGLFAELMTGLGYDRFAVQGGDWGAGIATWLAVRFPSRVVALHLNYIPGSFAPFVEGELSAEEASFLDQRAQWSDEQGAYGHVQRTRPVTLAYALSDSPAGLAAWIVEKFREWADPGSVVPLDVLLTNVTIYWATNSIASSMRLYLESARTPLRFERGERVRVPCGIARFPYEAPFPPRSWIERAYDVVRWTNMPQGGHFAALEAPERLAADVIELVRGVERSGVSM